MPLTSKNRQLFQGLSVLSAVACLLLIVLWVRSYYTVDYLHVYGPRTVLMESALGQNWIRTMRMNATFVSYWTETGSDCDPILDPSSLRALKSRLRGNDNRIGFGIYVPRNDLTVVVPSWSFVILFATLAAAPWIKPQFSLRTLLIATTLIAVVLGMLVFAIQ